jgi:hypothetical protein
VFPRVYITFTKSFVTCGLLLKFVGKVDICLEQPGTQSYTHSRKEERRCKQSRVRGSAVTAS